MIRRARPEDYSTFVRLFPELQVDDPVPARGPWETGLAPWTWIAERSDDSTPDRSANARSAAVGYLYCEEYADAGYVRNVVVAPEARRLGVGWALMRHAAEALRAAGKQRWCLNVKASNLAALRLYEGLGLEVAHTAMVVRLPWTALDALEAAGASDPELLPIVRVSAVAPRRYPVLEACFGLPSGQLRAAALKRRVLLEAIADGADDPPAAFAVFDPSFPGAFPFRLLDARFLAPMLRALEAHGQATVGSVQLVIDLVSAAEREAADRLIAVGATVRDQALHLEGRL